MLAGAVGGVILASLRVTGKPPVFRNVATVHLPAVLMPERQMPHHIRHRFDSLLRQRPRRMHMQA